MVSGVCMEQMALVFTRCAVQPLVGGFGAGWARKPLARLAGVVVQDGHAMSCGAECMLCLFAGV